MNYVFVPIRWFLEKGALMIMQSLNLCATDHGYLNLWSVPSEVNSTFDSSYISFLFKYSSLLNNCADGINVQAGKYPKFNNCADCNKCADWKISISYQIRRLENLQNLLGLQDGITQRTLEPRKEGSRGFL